MKTINPMKTIWKFFKSLYFGNSNGNLIVKMKTINPMKPMKQIWKFFKSLYFSNSNVNLIVKNNKNDKFFNH